mgnify:FL=1
MITLELVKLHLRVDGEDEDDLIRLYYEAAVSDCAAYLNRPLYQDEAAASEAAKAGKADGVVLNSSIRNAILLTVGYLYSTREDGAVGLPCAARRLLEPFRNLPGV